MTSITYVLRLRAIDLSCLAVVFLVSFCSVTVQTQTQRPIAFHDLKNSVQIQSMQLSPDGSMLAYANSWKTTDLWLVDTRQNSIPRHVGKGQFPRWSPDGKYLAYYSGESGSLQLWVLALKADHSEQVTHLEGGIDPNPNTIFIGWDGWLGDPLRYSWSPDSRKLVFASQVVLASSARQDISSSKGFGDAASADELSGSGPLVLTTTTPPEWTLAGVFRSGGFETPRHYVDGKIEKEPNIVQPQSTANQLFIVDIRSKTVTQLTHDNFQYFTPDWSPDGQRIVCVSMEGRPLLGWGSGPTNVYEFDVLTGKKRPLTQDSAYKRIPSWSPDGKWIAYFSAIADHPGRVSLLVMPAAGGRTVDLSTRLDRWIHDAHWLPDSESMAIHYQDGVDTPIAKISVPNGDIEIVSGRASADRQFMTLTVSRSGALAWFQSDGSRPASICLLPSGTPNPYVLADLEPETKNLQLGTQEIVRWRNGHGEDQEGVLIKPLGYVEGNRYPLIVDAYPKLKNSFKAWPMMPGQAWATRGYAVFYPNADGPHVWMNSWKSIAHNTAAKGAKGVDVAVDDVVSGVDELIRRGIVDSRYMCIYGFSNGGAMVNQVVTKTNRFKCAVSVAAASSADWSTPFFLQTGSRTISDVVGVAPWESPQTYIELSALYRLDKVSTPMLLADGDNDGFFLLGMIEMYNGLRYLGKDVTFLRYPNQGHGFEGAAMKDFWERENAFFDKYLRP